MDKEHYNTPLSDPIHTLVDHTNIQTWLVSSPNQKWMFHSKLPANFFVYIHTHKNCNHFCVNTQYSPQPPNSSALVSYQLIYSTQLCSQSLGYRQWSLQTFSHNQNYMFVYLCIISVATVCVINKILYFDHRYYY